MRNRVVWLTSLVTIGLCLLGTGCGQSAEEVPSSGLMLVLDPDLTIGSESHPDAVLTRVYDVTVGTQGDVFVVQWQTPAVLRFSSDGAFRGLIGRRGSGPGELIAPSRLGWVGDTLWVSDPSGARIELFHENGEHIRSVRVGGHFGEKVGESLRPWGILADGAVVLAGSPSIGMMARGAVTTRGLYRLHPGDSVVELRQLPVVEGDALLVPLNGGFLGGTPLLPSSPLWDAHPDGRFILLLDRSPYDRAAAPMITMEKFDGFGARFWEGAIPYEPVPVSAEWRDRSYRERAEQSGGGTPDRSIARIEAALRDHVNLPDYFPPVSRMIVGVDGTIWLRREPVSEEVHLWEVFDEDLDLVGRLEIPSSISLHQVSRTKVWATVHDEFDVPSLVRMHVTPADDG